MIVEAWDPALWIQYIHETEGTLNPQTHLSVTMAALVTDPTSLVFVSGVGFSDPIYTHRGLASLILHAYRYVAHANDMMMYREPMPTI